MIIKNFIENLFLTIGGITVFLYGLKRMSDGVQSIAGENMKKILSSATRSRMRGLLSGAAVTAVVQSSTATNIMLVGFVNVGAIGFAESIPVIMGANIGTTITAQLVSLSGSRMLNVTAIGSLVAFVGFLFSFSKKPRISHIGTVMLGFGFIFIGLEIMNESVYNFKNYEFFRRLFTAKNPLILFLNGFLITGIVQSSSAVSSILVVLAVNGLISFESSMYLLLGTNIGAGLAVLFVSSSMSEEARKVALANLLFNVVGAALCIVPILLFSGEIGAFFEMISRSTERQVANFHTAFNLIVSIVLLPFIKPFAGLIDRIAGWRITKRKKLKVQRAPTGNRL